MGIKKTCSSFNYNNLLYAFRAFGKHMLLMIISVFYNGWEERKKIFFLLKLTISSKGLSLNIGKLKFYTTQKLRIGVIFTLGR